VVPSSWSRSQTLTDSYPGRDGSQWRSTMRVAVDPAGGRTPHGADPDDAARGASREPSGVDAPTIPTSMPACPGGALTHTSIAPLRRSGVLFGCTRSWRHAAHKRTCSAATAAGCKPHFVLPASGENVLRSLVAMRRACDGTRTSGGAPGHCG
jgi:hypothetical protein